MILLLADDSVKIIDCHAWRMNEVFSDYFEQSCEMKFEESLISMI